MPRVSVIIPAFNAERHIRETLRSVQTQTYLDWEVVLADDCSTDGTLEAAVALDDARVRVVQTSENSGPATARNLAIAAASGELLAFLDADDYWLPGYLAGQTRLYDASGGTEGRVGIVASNARVLGPNGFLARTYVDYIGFPEKLTLTQLLRSNPIFVSALTSHKVVDEAGGFCAGILGTEDHDLWIRILELNYRVVANRDPQAVYRLSPDSLSADPRAMAHAAQIMYRCALARGNLTQRERRIARRELLSQRAVEQIATAEGISYRRALKTLPLLVLVAAQHPRRWISLARRMARRERDLSPFPI
jgi:teichuronic acid biosynthesis glycosyltransferase TuaG